MKKLVVIVFLFLFVAILSGCMSSVDSSKDGMRDAITYSTDQDKITVPQSFSELLDRCTVAAKVRILEKEPFTDAVYRYRCEVLEDYFANLDYSGMEDGCIYFYSYASYPQQDEMRYLFGSGRQQVYYPHIVYGTYDQGFVPTLKNGTLEFHLPETYGLAEESDIDALLHEYVAQNGTEDKLILHLPQIDSYEEMFDLTTDAWLVEVINFDREIGNEYCASLRFEIMDVLLGEYDYTSKEGNRFYTEMAPTDRPFEPGQRYLILRGIQPYYNTRNVLSKDYGYLSEDDPLFEVFLSRLR